jgi:hypothetical protein
VSLDDFLKRERLGDERLEPARSESVIHERLGPVQTLWVGRDLHHHVAANRDPIAQDVEQGQWRRLRAQRTVEEQDPQPGGRLSELSEGRAVDGVEYDTRALAARDPDGEFQLVMESGNGPPRPPYERYPGTRKGRGLGRTRLGLDCQPGACHANRHGRFENADRVRLMIIRFLHHCCCCQELGRDSQEPEKSSR